MDDKDLFYYFPYRIDKENNLRQWVKNQNGYFDLVLGRHDVRYENGKEIHFRHDTHFTEKEKRDNYLKFTNFLHWHKWFIGGQNIFAFSKELLEMLSLTDVDEISIDSIKLPYSSFYISLKPLNLKLDDQTKEIIEGVFVSDNPHLSDGHKRLEFQFAGTFEETYRHYSKSGLPHVYEGNFWDFSIDFDEERKIKTIKDALAEEIDFWKIEIFPEDDENVSDEITDNRLDFYNKKVKFSDNIIKLVINCLLYLSLPKEQQDVTKEYPANLPHNFNKKLKFARTKKETDSLTEKIKASGFSKINFVGTTYSRQRATSLNTGVFLSAHWRRGHWRHQPFGQGLKDKKLIWIQPTIVNKDKGEPTKGHIYNVTE